MSLAPAKTTPSNSRSPSPAPVAAAAANTPSTAAPSSSTTGSWFRFANPFLTVVERKGDPDEVAQLTVEEGVVEEGEGEVQHAPVAAAKNPQKNSNNAADKARLAKEAELRKREAEVAAREAQLLEAQRRAVPRVPNFPPCWPVMFHDIRLDIPAATQPNMLWMFRSFMFLFLVLFVNCGACLAILVSHPAGVTTGGRDFGVSIMYLFLVMVLAFYFWYRPVYNAYLKESSMLYSFFFLFNGIQILFDFYMALGIPGSGSAGIIYALSILTDSKYVAGILCATTGGMWLVAALSSMYLYHRTHRHYRSRGLTAEDAKNEAVKAVGSTGIAQGLFVKSAFV
ncbi:scamp family-domain-containing protein [Zopfochytrium polystomum]|nr:scamp family-domain-containing protein [Zopfochytrium polystomum]